MRVVRLKLDRTTKNFDVYKEVGDSKQNINQWYEPITPDVPATLKITIEAGD